MDGKTFKEKEAEVSEKALAALGLDLTEEGKTSKAKPSGEGGSVGLKVSTKTLKDNEEEEESTDGVQPEEEGKEQKEDEVESEEKSTEEEKETTEEEEELIPKSKYEKVKSRLEQRVNALTAQLKQQEQTKATVNSTREKLEQLNEKDLLALEDEVDDALFDARTANDTSKLSQLRNLRRELRDVIVTTPKRFVEKQVSAYNDSANSILNDPANEDIDFTTEAETIKKIATQIYSNKPDLQGLVRGQALALELAVEYYRDTKKLNQGKTKEASLKRELVKQKQKTTLGTSKSTGTPRTAVNMKKEFESAKRSGSDHDKAAFLGKLLDIDEYLR